MKIAVLENKNYTNAIKISECELGYGVKGFIRKGVTRLHFLTTEYGIDDTPVNIDKLDRKQQLAYIKLYTNSQGHYLSSKAYALAQQLGVA